MRYLAALAGLLLIALTNAQALADQEKAPSPEPVAQPADDGKQQQPQPDKKTGAEQTEAEPDCD